MILEYPITIQNKTKIQKSEQKFKIFEFLDFILFLYRDYYTRDFLTLYIPPALPAGRAGDNFKFLDFCFIFYLSTVITTPENF